MEQLKYILHELKTSYPKQYRVFINANANPLDLAEHLGNTSSGTRNTQETAGLMQML